MNIVYNTISFSLPYFVNHGHCLAWCLYSRLGGARADSAMYWLLSQLSQIAKMSSQEATVSAFLWQPLSFIASRFFPGVLDFCLARVRVTMRFITMEDTSVVYSPATICLISAFTYLLKTQCFRTPTGPIIHHTGIDLQMTAIGVFACLFVLFFFVLFLKHILSSSTVIFNDFAIHIREKKNIT